MKFARSLTTYKADKEVSVGKDEKTKRIALIYNPSSGNRRERRLQDILTVRSTIQSQGHEAFVIPTRTAGSAGDQTREAIAAGYDTIFACGGDGTVNEVLQGIVNTDAVLGVIPLGTANCLANDLGLALHPAKAAEELLSMQPRSVAVGVLEYGGDAGAAHRRYFTVAAGIGVDAELMSKTSTELKKKFGFLAYGMRGAELYARGNFPMFSVTYTDAITRERKSEVASQVIVARIGYFGALLKNFVPGASLTKNYAQIVIFKTASRLKYLCYVLDAFRGRLVPGADVVFAPALDLSCAPPLGMSNEAIHIEADGDLMGSLPAKISMLPGALRLLMSPRKEV